MDQNLKNTILDYLTKAENIVIVASSQLGFDGLAAGLALNLSLLKLDKSVSVVAQTPTVGDAQSLYGVDKIEAGKNSKTPVVVVQNAVETVDRVTHFLDKSDLKLVLHPLPGSPQITEDQISIEYTSSPANLIFTIGVDNLPDLRKSFTHEQEISPDAMIICIGNTQPSQKFAQIDVVNTQASGVSEVCAQMLADLALPVDEDIAFNLYSGIRESTNNFSPNLVSPMSFEIAKWLLKFGAGKASLAKGQSYEGSRPQPRPLVHIEPQPFTPPPVGFQKDLSPIEEVEPEPQAPEAPKSGDWLKPPKIYKGSKSFNGENKG